MAQLTVRLDDDLAEDVRLHAELLGRSVNSWVVALMRTAIDPEFADSDVARTRGRLARAGLLVTPRRRTARQRPGEDAFAAARTAAGKGTPLAEIVVRDRR